MTKNIKLKSYKHQHFLKNKKILLKEIKISRLKKIDEIIEIGAGDGRLTNLISQKVKSIISFEIDKRFKQKLESLNLKNTTFIFDNAIKYSWQNHNKIVANIPYSLSEQILIKSIKENIQLLTLIIGENFKKILENKNEHLGFLSNLFYEFNPIEKIDKKEFEPQPRVNSWLIQLKRKPNSIIQNIYLRKGKIKNAILYSLVKSGKTKKQAREIIANSKIPKDFLEESTRTLNGNKLKKINENIAN